MSILIPALPAPKSAAPELITWGSLLTPPGGGEIQRLNRMGDRYRLSVTIQRRATGDALRILLVRLRQALTQGALYAFPQPDLAIGVPGSPVVNGAGQQGSFLNLRGFAPGYLIRANQFFSIVHGGRRHLVGCDADTIADPAGRAALPVTPMLRIRPADGAVCEFAEPKIEGFLTGNSVAWTYERAFTTPPEFQITEAA